MDNKDKSLLDIGCGTGNLTLELSKRVKRIAGIDADREMVNRARSKSKAYGNNVRFICLDMLEIQEHFPSAEFDLIFSFGNTIAHLKDGDELKNLLRQTREAMKAEGVLLLQTVNFDRVLKEDVRLLPVIENEKIKFERFYDRRPKGGRIDFRTILTDKKNNRIIENRVPLLPILKGELERDLKSAGYRRPVFYGGFTREPWTEESPALVVEAFNPD